MWGQVSDWFGNAVDWTTGAAEGVFDAATGLLTGVASTSREISGRVGETFETLAGETARTQREQQRSAANILGMSSPNIVILGALLLVVIIVAVSR